MRPYTGCLCGIADNPVEVRGYLELRTTFTDGAASRTESIRYLVVNANSAYNILLGRPALKRLRVVSSTRHMKMKLPDLSGKVIMIKSDQEEARKCYENSLKTKRGVVMVIERPLVSDSQMQLELFEEATPAKSTPVEATLGATPIEDAYTEGGNGDASPMEGVRGKASPAEEEPEEAMPDASIGATPMEEDSTNESLAENAQNERPQPEDNIVERQIRGKGVQDRTLAEPRRTRRGSRSNLAPPRCFRMDCGGHARCRPRLFMPPSHHGRQGSPCETKMEEVQRRAMPRREGRNTEAAQRRTHQGDTIP